MTVNTIAPTVLLYNPLSTTPGKQRLPMSLLAIARVIEGDYTPEIIDGNLVDNPAPLLIERARQTKAKILGMTVMPGPQLRQAIPLAREIKAAVPDMAIVWGGYFPTHFGDMAVQSGYVDYAVEGQGEAPFRKLVDVIHKGGRLEDVPSLIWQENHTLHHSPRAPLVPLDNLPLFPYHRVNMDDYKGRSYLGKSVLSHHSSFGCPFSCSFCAVVRMVNQRWLPEAPERVEQVMDILTNQYGADGMEFHDMDFFIREDRVADITDRIARFNLNWWGLGRVDTLSEYTDDTWVKMQKSGCKMIFMGAESGSLETLKLMNKGGKSNPERTLYVAERMKHLGIVPEFSFVLGNPPDPMADIDQTIQFIRKLKQINPATELILYIYTPVPHDRSELLKAAKEMGFAFPQKLEEWADPAWETFSLRRNPETPFFKDKARRQVRDFEAVINAYYPTVTDIRLRGSMRKLLQGLATWRYKLEFYHWPYELKALQRLVHYRRPETTGF